MIPDVIHTCLQSGTCHSARLSVYLANAQQTFSVALKTDSMPKRSLTEVGFEMLQKGTDSLHCRQVIMYSNSCLAMTVHIFIQQKSNGVQGESDRCGLCYTCNDLYQSCTEGSGGASHCGGTQRCNRSLGPHPCDISQ